MLAGSVHLVVIHHGLWGSPANTEYLATTLAKYHGGLISPHCTLTPPECASTISALASTHPNSTNHIRMVVLNSEVNSGDHTYDGIDWCAERLIKDVYREVERIEQDENAKVAKLSLIGYSLGGLVIRYAAGVMYSDGLFAESKCNTGKKLMFTSRPVAASMSTIATPHLGVTLTGSMFSKVAAAVGRSNLGRTGKQLYLADRGWKADSHLSTQETPKHAHAQSDEDEGLCLIEALSDPRFNFITAMRLFSRIDVYANAVADLTVSYRTAAFEAHDPFVLADQIHLVRDPDHPPLVVSFSITKPCNKTTPFWSTLAAKLSPNNLPWMLNPQRFPIRFPLNYVALLCLPVVLPVMVGLVLHKLRSDSRVSNRRVEEFERLWAVENAGLSGKDPVIQDDSLHRKNGKKDKSVSTLVKLDAATRGELERNRVVNLLATVEAEVEETFREVGEDYVRTSAPMASPAPSDSRYITKTNDATTFAPRSSYASLPEQQPLLPPQHRILSNLNNASLLPQVKKHLAHFPDVLNSHAVIIVRTPTMDAHKKGMQLIKAFVQRFEL